MSEIDTISAPHAGASPLSDAMLVMDVVDTLRRNPDLRGAGEVQLIDGLRATYRRQGIDVSEAILQEGIAASASGRYVYEPPRTGAGAALARLYVSRLKWGRPALAIVLMLAIGLGGYFLVYRPYREAQAEQARLELAETLPAEMDALYGTIYLETKVQQAANEAAAIRDRGKTAAGAGDRAGALAAIADLTAIRDTLRREYRLLVVNRPDTKSALWRIPEISPEAANYYVVVEAIDPQGNPLTLPVRNEETGQTEAVKIWAMRVPEAVYRAVEADRLDDGIIQHNLVGIKQFGFLDPDYAVQVTGGAITRW